MVVSLNVCILMFVGIVVASVYLFFLIFKKEKKYTRPIRLILLVALVMTNVLILELGYDDFNVKPMNLIIFCLLVMILIETFTNMKKNK